MAQVCRVIVVINIPHDSRAILGEFLEFGMGHIANGSFLNAQIGDIAFVFEIQETHESVFGSGEGDDLRIASGQEILDHVFAGGTGGTDDENFVRSSRSHDDCGCRCKEEEKRNYELSKQVSVLEHGLWKVFVGIGRSLNLPQSSWISFCGLSNITVK